MSSGRRCRPVEAHRQVHGAPEQGQDGPPGPGSFVIDPLRAATARPHNKPELIDA